MYETWVLVTSAWDHSVSRLCRKADLVLQAAPQWLLAQNDITPKLLWFSQGMNQRAAENESKKKMHRSWWNLRMPNPRWRVPVTLAALLPTCEPNSKAKNRNLRVPFTGYTTRASLRMQTQGAWIPRWHARRCRWLAPPSAQMLSDLAINFKNTQKKIGTLQGQYKVQVFVVETMVLVLSLSWQSFGQKNCGPIRWKTWSIFTVHSVIMSQCRNVIQCHTMSRKVKNLSKLSEFLWPLLHWACVIFTSFFFLRIFVPWQTGCSWGGRAARPIVGQWT